MTPSSIRGAVVSAKETVIVFGILVGYWAGDWCSDSSDSSSSSSGNNNASGSWTRLYAVSAALAVPMLGLTFCIPRSLRWLLMHGHRAEAADSMRFVYKGDKDAIMAEFQHLAGTIETSSSSSTRFPVAGSDKEVRTTGVGLIFTKLLSPPVWPAFRAAMGLIALQQFSGQPSLLSYAAVIFNAAGWNGRAATVTAVLMLCTSTATVLTVDRFGRKRLLSACCAVLATAAFALSWQFWGWKSGGGGEEGSEVFGSAGKLVVLIAMFLYIGGFQIGFGPITWLIVSEVFPGDVRGAATAMGVELNYLLNFVVQFLVPIAKDRIGWGPTFGMFAFILLFALSFVQRYVPETAGLTLEEIEEHISTRHLRDEEIETVMGEHYPLVSKSQRNAPFAVYVENAAHS